jgi:mucin-desulfating sulfatase
MGRVASVRDILSEIERNADEMCLAEKLYRDKVLPKRICHCDTKVNNMLFDSDGKVLCVIDLDTVMPSFIFSDYGDFLRTGANYVAEDSDDYQAVGLKEDIFCAFTEGYLSTAGSFLTTIEISHLPYAVALFPFMQCVRFLTDYINGDVYFKTKYAEHNYVRSRNQLLLYHDVRRHDQMMNEFIKKILKL